MAFRTSSVMMSRKGESAKTAAAPDCGSRSGVLCRGEASMVRLYTDWSPPPRWRRDTPPHGGAARRRLDCPQGEGRTMDHEDFFRQRGDGLVPEGRCRAFAGLDGHPGGFPAPP